MQLEHRTMSEPADSAEALIMPEQTPTVFIVDDDFSGESLELLIKAAGWPVEQTSCWCTRHQTNKAHGGVMQDEGGVAG